MTEVKIEAWPNGGWTNSVEVINKLYSIPCTEPVIIFTDHEGFSLKSFGVLQVIDQWVVDTGRLPSTVKINSPNCYEKTNYQFLYQQKIPHFFSNNFVSKYLHPSRQLAQTENYLVFL